MCEANTGLGSCIMAGFGVSCVQFLDFAIGVLVNKLLKNNVRTHKLS
jgi:hypothetical protein